jgi:hypothetical protein
MVEDWACQLFNLCFLPLTYHQGAVQGAPFTNPLPPRLPPRAGPLPLSLLLAAHHRFDHAVLTIRGTD